MTDSKVTAAGRSSAMPPLQPLPMPSQDLRRAPPGAKMSELTSTHVARGIAYGGAALLTAYAGREMWWIIDGPAATIPQFIWLLLFVVSFAWIAFSATSAIAGLLPRGRVAASQPAVPDARVGSTALVMPVYNEDPSHTAATLETIASGLQRLGLADDFEVFILSDTRDPGVWIQETAAYQALRRSLGRGVPVWYRRRYANTGRKAGNVRSFIEDWGGRYEFMIVLDADSLMAPETVRAMIERMRADPSLGLLQTVPRLHGGHTLFARLQQFAGFLYGPIVARGVAAWQGRSGNFWGHNAAIRVSAFAAACGLPELPGRPPFGGSILSHDFVEAALLRRAGWRVVMEPDLGGSWEEPPPTLAEMATRDRRWAQGNLQHLKVISAAGLAWSNRVHFGIGVMNYLASPLWLALITLGLIIAIQASLVRPEFFAQPFQLFPTWPKFDSQRMIGLFVFSMLVLLTPKAIGVFSAVIDKVTREAGGGGVRLVLSAMLELVLSALYAPVLMLIQSRQIYEIVRRRDAGWRPQIRKSDGSIPWRDIWRQHWQHFTIGLSVAAVVGFISLVLLAWISPVLLGLLLAPVLAASGGSEEVGRALARKRLLSIPDETRPHPLKAECDRARERYERTLADLSPKRLLVDPMARRGHFDAVTPPSPPSRGDPDLATLSARAKLVDAQDADEALGWLTTEELLAVLANRELFERIPGIVEVEWRVGEPELTPPESQVS